MHPALSVIFFTTLSGAGYGLLAWLGLSVLLLHARADVMPLLYPLQLWGLLLGLGLSTAGLLCSLAHLGRPLRAWRALSQWRTSWLSREGLLALATTLPALALGALLLWAPAGPERAIALGACGLLLAALALCTVASTAMIYASLPPIPAWRHPVVVPVYLLFALLTGLGLMFWLMAVLLPPAGSGAAMPATLGTLSALLLAAKWLYWRDLDRQALPASRGAAVGLPDRSVTVFERPHTEASYVTREMAFAVARRHSLRLRLLAAALLLGAPVAAWALVATTPVPLASLLGATLVALLMAGLVERWLFFAEARHVVTLYY